MTPQERRKPEIINGSRKRRIAAGAGLQVPDLNRLLKQHKQMQKMMKKAGKKGGMQKMMRGMSGMMGGGGPGGPGGMGGMGGPGGFPGVEAHSSRAGEAREKGFKAGLISVECCVFMAGPWVRPACTLVKEELVKSK